MRHSLTITSVLSKHHSSSLFVQEEAHLQGSCSNLESAYMETILSEASSIIGVIGSYNCSITGTSLRIFF